MRKSFLLLAGRAARSSCLCFLLPPPLSPLLSPPRRPSRSFFFRRGAAWDYERQYLSQSGIHGGRLSFKLINLIKKEREQKKDNVGCFRIFSRRPHREGSLFLKSAPPGFRSRGIFSRGSAVTLAEWKFQTGTAEVAVIRRDCLFEILSPDFSLSPDAWLRIRRLSARRREIILFLFFGDVVANIVPRKFRSAAINTRNRAEGFHGEREMRRVFIHSGCTGSTLKYILRVLRELKSSKKYSIFLPSRYDNN